MICKINSASFYEKSFQTKRSAFADFQIIALSEKTH